MWISPETLQRVLRLNRLIHVLLLVSLSTSAYSQGWFRQKTVEDRFNKAVEYYNEGRFGSAESALKKILEKDQEEYEEAVQLMLMKSRFQNRDIEESKKIGLRYLNNELFSDYRPNVIEVLGDIFIYEGNYSAALRHYLLSNNGYDSNSVSSKRVFRKVSHLFGLRLSSDVVSELVSTELDTVSQVILNLIQAFEKLAQGEQGQASHFLGQISPENVPDELFSIYEQLILSSYQEKSTVATVGIVAPLTGINSIEGRTFLRGIQQAFKHHLRVGHKVGYIIYDNISDEIETARAITQLINNPNVTAIIAPQDERDALISTAMVTKSTVPVIIPTSVQDGLTDLSSNIFQFNSNLSIRGEFAAKYALNNMRAKSIAVVAPADIYGKTLVDAFLKELDLNGIEPVSVEWYSDIPNNLSSEFSTIRKRAWTLVPQENEDEEYLGMELDSLDALFDISEEDFFDLPEEDDKKSLSRSDSAEVVLETIDAIFIPAHESHISFIGTQFPVYNLKTTIIGTEGWYHPEILDQETIGPHIDGMVLITNEFPNERVKEDLPESITDPSIYYLGYDTAQMLLHIAAKTQNDPVDFIEQLGRVDGIHGKFHSYAFDPKYKNANIALHVLSYENRVFRDVGFFNGDSLNRTYFPAP